MTLFTHTLGQQITEPSNFGPLLKMRGSNLQNVNLSKSGTKQAKEGRTNILVDVLLCFLCRKKL